MVVVHHNESFAVALFHFYHFVGFSFFVHPSGNQLTVAHVRFFNVFSGLNAGELRHQSIHYKLIIFGFVSFFIGQKTKFHYFRIGHIIQPEEVGTRFFYCGTVGFQRIRIDTRQQFARTMTKTFVKVGVQVVGDGCKILGTLAFGIAPHKFFGKAIAQRSLIVSFGDVFDGHRFRTVFGTNPVGIGQVHTDRSGGVTIAGKDGSCYHLGRNAFYFFFFEFRIDRRIVLEPLRVGAYGLGTFCRFYVFEVNDRFPACFHAQRVAVSFGKSVHEVDLRVQVLHPFDRILIVGVQVAGFVKAYQTPDHFLLLIVFGYCHCLFEPAHDAFDGLCVKSAYFICLFHKLAVFFYKFAVQSVRNGSAVVRVFHIGIKSFHFGLCHAFAIVVVARSEDQIHAIGLIGTFGIERRVENHRSKLTDQFIYCFAG